MVATFVLVAISQDWWRRLEQAVRDKTHPPAPANAAQGLSGFDSNAGAGKGISGGGGGSW